LSFDSAWFAAASSFEAISRAPFVAVLDLDESADLTAEPRGDVLLE
jgi:hypothetical protein